MASSFAPAFSREECQKVVDKKKKYREERKAHSSPEFRAKTAKSKLKELLDK